MTRKGLLIVSGGAEAIHGIERARAMGLHVIVSDGDPAALGFALAHGRIVASTYDPQATLRAARDYARQVHPIHGVIAMGADVPHTVSAVAAALGLPGLAEEIAARCIDKLAMKDRLAARGVPIPWYAPIRDAHDLRAILARRGTRLVLKPVDSRGGRGVQRLWRCPDREEALGCALEHSPSRRAMVEAYLDGPQISTESIMLAGTAHTPGFSDRNYEFLDRFAPWFVENGGDLPGHLDPATRRDVEDTAAAAARALGIDNHQFKGDMAVHRGRAHVIEIAARLSGGYFCTREIPLSTGVDFVGAAIRLALGEAVTPADLAPRFERPIVQRYVFPPPGRIRSISGMEAARALPGVLEAVTGKQPGDVIPPPTWSGARAAMVIATGETPEEARANAARAIAAISVEIEPERRAA